MIFSTALNFSQDLVLKNIVKVVLKGTIVKIFLVYRKIIGFVFFVEIFAYVLFAEEREEKKFQRRESKEKILLRFYFLLKKKKLLETKYYDTPHFFFEIPKNISNDNIVKSELLDTSKYENYHPFGISLKNLLDQNLINFGDKLVFQNTCFTGEVLSNGDIKLEWNSHIVPNIVSFVESCGICYSDDCLDKVFCNGVKLRSHMENYIQTQTYYLNYINSCGILDFDTNNGDGVNFTVDSINQMNHMNVGFDQKFLTDNFSFSDCNQTIVFYENKNESCK